MATLGKRLNTTEATERLWDGRFKSGPSLALENLSRSDPSLFRLAPYDLAGSRAHANELERAGIRTAAELQQLLDAMQQIENEFLKGNLSPILADEDVQKFRSFSRINCSRMRSQSIAMSIAWSTGIGAAHVRRLAPPRWQALQFACGPICPRSNSATTARARTPSTPSLRATTSRSSRLWRSICRGCRRKSSCGHRGSFAGSNSTMVMPPVVRSCRRRRTRISRSWRGKAGRLIGNLNGLLATLKSLPLPITAILQRTRSPHSTASIHLNSCCRPWPV